MTVQWVGPLLIELKKEKKLQVKALKAAERKVNNIKKKAVQLSNNDLMEVFLLRKEEEAARMDSQALMLMDGLTDDEKDSKSSPSSGSKKE